MPMSDASCAANKARAHEFYKRISAGDLSVVDELVADGYVEHEQVPGLAPGRPGYGSCSRCSTPRSATPGWQSMT
jgi:hypothetical protein